MMWKQFLYYLLIIILTVSVLALFTSREIRRHHIRQIETNLKYQAELVEEISCQLLLDRDNDRINEIVRKMGKKIGTRITVIEADGEVAGDSEEDPASMENHAQRPEIAKALRGEIGESVRFSTTVKKDMMYVALPVKENGRIVGVIRTSLPLKEVQRLISRINRRIFYGTIVLIAFSVILTLVSSRAFAKPINEIVRSTRGIARGDFTTRISTRRNDELGELANALNWMTEKIQKLFSEVTTEKEGLAAILSSMTEGVVVLNPDGQIVMTNDGFRNICRSPISSSDQQQTNETIMGKQYWEVLRNRDFKRLIDEVNLRGEAEALEIHADDRTYLGNASLTPKKDRTVVVLHDITEIKRLERMKSEFVASASHELRTPLTAIKGFVETLIEAQSLRGRDRLQSGSNGKQMEHQRFLQIISRHTDRMNSLVSDLLLLSELETKEQKLETQNIDLKEMLSDVTSVFKNKADDKGLKIELVVPDEFPTVKGDSFFIEQIFVNLLDNAVKYTQQGSVTIELLDLDKQVRIEISDTGVGIPEKDVARIFERFYTVDKARSRELGGTGLGLSIVKHIVLAHNGKIDVQSQPNKGSTFTVMLPKG
jgi:two-component system phosphate regulon sensor histidine kinase PhoR